MQIKRNFVWFLMLGMFFFVSGSGITGPAASGGEWQTAKVGDFMTVKIPGQFKVTSLELNEEIRKKIDSMENYVMDMSNNGEYLCMVTYTRYNKGIMGDLDGAAAGAIKNMKNQPTLSDFKVNQKYIRRFQMKGIRLDGSFMGGGKKATFKSEIYVKRNILWMLLILDSGEKQLPAVSKKILDSLKINAK